jgi:beta-glucanase (GH16 family)
MMRIPTLLALLALCTAFAAPQDAPLAWSDEFDGAPGSPPDSSKWVYDLGASGWGNHELENYTDNRGNSYLDGQGHLVIQALQAEPGKFTSARLKTKGKFSFTYGRIEARIQIPYGQGVWPAFWMLGDRAGQGWPDNGEIDIMENIGREPTIVHGTVHGPGYSNSHGISKDFKLEKGRFADDFHVYAVDWAPESIEFFVDGTRYHTVTPASLPSGKKWVYDHPFYVLLNVAIGGDWPGKPDASTQFPQRMLIDYVRVYKN